MLEAVTVTNYLGESLRMKLTDPMSSGLNIVNITGIGAPDASIVTNDMAISDGSLFASSRAEEREITLTLWPQFLPDVETARHLTYKYFPVKRKCRLTFETDHRTVFIDGYVKSNNPTIFAKTEVIEITMVCPDPWFRAAGGDATVIFSGLEYLFEFPFSNESLTENLLIMSELHETREGYVDYEGDASTGFKLYVHAVGPASNVRLFDVSTGEKMIILTDKIAAVMAGVGFQAEDEIIVNTQSGEKSVQLLRSGNYYNIINALDRSSDWLTLKPGRNTLAYLADSGDDNLEFKITYVAAYQGV